MARRTYTEEFRIDTATLRAYYLENSIGKQAILPSKYNRFTEGDIYFTTLLNDIGYSIIDNSLRQIACTDGRIVKGTPTLDLVLNSPRVVEIRPVHQ